MTDWVDELDPEGREQWDRFVEHFRQEAVEMIAGSGAFISLVPTRDKLDVKFATELGAAIMLDKPIISLAMPGAVIPESLRRISAEVVEADIDTEEGREQLIQALDRLFGKEKP
jgi:hypothetical protein